MFTLLGSLLGFLGSLIPDIMRLYREGADRGHELAILDRQIALMQQGHRQRLEEIQTIGDSEVMKALYHQARPTGVPWIDGLAGTVRPILTYGFFVMYMGIKIAQWHVLSRMLLSTEVAFSHLWHGEDQALFATIVSFWFGQRLLSKSRALRGQ